jgi:polar amino acid transport system substrate-binding protein
MISRLLLLVSCLASLFCASAARADMLDTILRRGEVVVGVKTDYPPFGQLNAAGEIVGFEPDLAADVAKRLGVRLRLVSVTSANRLQQLQDGTVDLIIATLGDTQQRREIADLIEPNYYASGINIMLPQKSVVKDWSDMVGRTVCGTQGQYANRVIQERYLLQLQLLNSNRDSLLALRKGSCAGWLQDDTLIMGLLTGSEWAEYAMPLRSILVVPWSIAIRAADRDSRLERTLSDIVADWHRSGFLIATQRAYNMPPTAFLRSTNELWNRLGPDGTPVCHRGPQGEWPTLCRNTTLVSSNSATGIERVGLLVKERTGLDFSFIYDRYDSSIFFFGLLRTIELLIYCVIGSLAVGTIGALLMSPGVPVLGHCVKGLLTFFRMTPPLLQIYVVFFGVGNFLAANYGLSIGAVPAAVLCLSCYAGAAIAQSLVDAATVLHRADPDFVLRPATLLRTFNLAQGPVIGSLVNVVKAGGMASVIAVPEIISASTAIMADRGNTGVMMNVLMAVYFLILLGVVRLFSMVQRRLPPA